MKRIGLLLTLILGFTLAFGQSQSVIKWDRWAVTGSVAVGKGGTGWAFADTSALFEIGKDTSERGFLTARGYKDSVKFPKKGLQIHDLATNSPWYHNGSAWVQIGAATDSTIYLTVFREDTAKVNIRSWANSVFIHNGTSAQAANFNITGRGRVKSFVGSTSDSVYVRDTTGAIAIGYTDDTSASVVKATGVSTYANGVAIKDGKIIASGNVSKAGGWAEDSSDIVATGNQSLAFGLAQNKGRIIASGSLSAAIGYASKRENGLESKLEASGYNSIASGVAWGSNVIASGQSSTVRAFNSNNTATASEAVASGNASFVNVVLSNGGSAKASGNGSAIFGTAQRRGYLLASGPGSFVTGIIPSSGVDSQNIRASLNGAVAHGNAEQGGSIFSDGAGSMAGGCANKGNIVSGKFGSATHGSFAWGQTYWYSSILGAVGESAFAFGFANTDSLWSADTLSVTFGENVKNYGKHSFAFGKGYRNSRNNQAVFGWNNYKDFRVDGENHVLLTNNDADTLATLANTRGLGYYIHNGTTQQTADFNITGVGVMGKIGLGVTPSTYMMDINTNSALLGSDFLTDGLRSPSSYKAFRIGVPHYNQTTPSIALQAINTDLNNELRIGGGTSAGYAATVIQFYTGSNITTLTGTLRGSIVSSGNWVIGSGSDNGNLMQVYGNLYSSGQVRSNAGFNATGTTGGIAYTATLANNNELGYRIGGTIAGNMYHTFSNASAGGTVYMHSANFNATGDNALSLNAVNGRVYSSYNNIDGSTVNRWFAGMDNSAGGYMYKVGYSTLTTPFGTVAFAITTGGNAAFGYSTLPNMTNKLSVNGNLLVNDTVITSAIRQRGRALILDSFGVRSIDWRNRNLFNSNGDTAATFYDGFQGRAKITTITDADHSWDASETIIEIKGLTANRTVTINPATLNKGVIYTLKNKDGTSSGVSAITLSLSSGTIDGVSTMDIDMPYGSLSFYSDGTDLIILSKN